MGIRYSYTDSIFAYRVDLGTTIGLSERDDAEAIKACPDSMMDVIYFHSRTSAELTISSMDGAEVHHNLGPGNVSIDLSNFASGVFSMMPRSEGSMRTQKILPLLNFKWFDGNAG